MENGRGNFEKNKYNAQIRGEQVSNLEKEKSNNKLADKIENGLNIHSMPNFFRAGKFNSSVHPNDIQKESALKNLSSNPHKHKYVGVLIIVVGVLILGGLSYFLYSYIIEDSQINNAQIAQEDNSADNKRSDEENINLRDGETENGNDTDEIATSTEPLDEIATSTEPLDEIATSTEPVDEDIATSTEETMIVKDTDGDGLSDLEEHLLNTNINLEDSDSDGYNDANEVINLYNPAGTNTLVDNPGISEYSNPLHSYTILHPQAWTRKISNEGDSVMFMNENEGFFQISVEDNNESLSIEDWYRQEFNLDENENLNYFSENNEMISSKDELFVYYTDQEKIYVFSYTVMSQSPSYPIIFKAFVNSFTRY